MGHPVPIVGDETLDDLRARAHAWGLRIHHKVFEAIVEQTGKRNPFIQIVLTGEGDEAKRTIAPHGEAIAATAPIEPGGVWTPGARASRTSTEAAARNALAEALRAYEAARG